LTGTVAAGTAISPDSSIMKDVFKDETCPIRYVFVREDFSTHREY
jgi:hypothetical protein